MSRNQATRPGPRTRGPRAGGSPKINWAVAFAHYCSEPTVSGADVAQTFGVSLTAVQNHMRREGWVARREALHEEARSKLERDLVKSLEEANRSSLLVIDEYREALRSELREGKVKPSGKDLAQLIRVEQLIRGEATDRVSVPEVRAFVQRLAVGLDTLLTGLVGEYVANGKRARLVAAFRAELGPVFEDAVAAAGMQLEPAVGEGQ